MTRINFTEGDIINIIFTKTESISHDLSFDFIMVLLMMLLAIVGIELIFFPVCRISEVN